MIATAKKPKNRAKKQPGKRWQTLLRLIPGYDPFRGTQYDGGGESWFDERAAQQALEFFPECIKHAEGELLGTPFILEPWQQCVVANIVGWKRLDKLGREVRRYRESLIYVPRKNGKTPWIAALGLYIFFCDGEPGAQCFIAAGAQDQAGQLFRHAKFMVQNEVELAERSHIYGGNAQAGQSKSIVREEDGSFLKIISADSDTKHGGNTHLALIDELHVQPNRNLVDVFRTSMSSQNRKQPLLIYITTADFKRESICNEIYAHACKVRDGVLSDPAFLPVIYEAKADDDWSSPEVWKKANPNLGVSKSWDYMERECKLAQQNPAYLNTFLRLDLNVQTDTDVCAIPMDKWDASSAKFDESELRRATCMAGLDLSTTTDITAFVMLFRPDEPDGKWYVVPRFWIPGENAQRRSDRDRVPYVQWIRDGLITAHDGNRLDYGLIRKEINELSRIFNIKQVAIDPWNAMSMMLELQGDGFDVVEFRQGFASMSSPTKELLAMVGAGQLAHGGNPVLRWMASNAATLEDPAGNLKFAKNKSTERIDGIVALTMALGLWLSNDPGGNRSVYDRDSRGFTVIG